MRGGMFHGIDTRQTSINILREKVVPLITQILEKEEQQEEETEMMLTPSQQIKETETSTPPPTHPKPIIEPQGESPRGENLRKSKYSSDNPPKIPAGFHVDWEAKKWRAFCLFYGYSPKTGKFDNQPHTREQIAEVLQVTIFDIAVYFSSNKKYLASWKPKPKKQPKPAQVKEKWLKPKKTAKTQKPLSSSIPKIPRSTTVSPSPIKKDKKTNKGEEHGIEAEYDEENEGDEDKYTNETLEVPDGISDILKGCLRHAILSEQEEKKLWKSIQSHVRLKDELRLETELLLQIKTLINYATPKIQDAPWFQTLKRISHVWEPGLIIKWASLKYLYDLAKWSLLWTKEFKKESADVVLWSICREMPTIAKEACDKLMIHNLRLVFHIARDYRNYWLDIEDLFSEGVIWLQKAALRFEPWFETKFSTYAAWWIKQAIRRALANQARIIRIPVHRQDKQQIFKRVINIIAGELWREPTNEELSEELGIELKKILILREWIKKPISLDAPINSEDDSDNHHEFIAHSQDNEDELALTWEEKQKIINLLNILNPREKNIIERRFGLNGYQPQTLEEISQEPEYSMTRERVRQIEAGALVKLRKKMGGNFAWEREIGLNNDFEDLKVARLAESVRQSTLSPHEKSILISWCRLGKESVSLSMIAERNGMSYIQAQKMIKNALKKIPPLIKSALEIRGNSNL